MVQAWTLGCGERTGLVPGPVPNKHLRSTTPRELGRDSPSGLKMGERADAPREAERDAQRTTVYESAPATSRGGPQSPAVGIAGSGPPAGHRMSPPPLPRDWLSARDLLSVTSRGGPEVCLSHGGGGVIRIS